MTVFSLGLKQEVHFLRVGYAERIDQIEGKEIRTGELDITLYRDDLFNKT